MHRKSVDFSGRLECTVLDKLSSVGLECLLNGGKSYHHPRCLYVLHI